MPGSRLNLNPYQQKDLENKYFEANNFARKSYGGNTQQKYKDLPAEMLDPFNENKNAVQSKLAEKSA